MWTIIGRINKHLDNIEILIKTLGEDRVLKNEPMSLHTTLGIGGPAELYFETSSSQDLIKVVRLCRSVGMPITVIGGGSNILVGDLGIRGLVVKNMSGRVDVAGERVKSGRNPSETVATRWQADANRGTFLYDFADLDYDEWDEERVEVVVDSGVSLAAAMMRLIEKDITGLQWYARIPGTIGGAVFNNIHGGTHTIGEVVERATVIDESGEVRVVEAADLGMGYDVSRFHKNKEVILDVTLSLYAGNVDKARWVVSEWSKRKAIQPGRSAGCVFKNICDEDKERLGFPTASVGYLVEHVLKLGDFKVGGAGVSSAHRNFIVNEGGATATDYLTIKNKIISSAKELCGIDLESEVIELGEFK